MQEENLEICSEFLHCFTIYNLLEKEIQEIDTLISSLEKEEII